MGRLIDADALIAQMEADAEQMEEPIAKMFTYAAINDLKHAPTIESERKTGKWIHHPEWEEDGDCGYECSEFHMGSDVDYNFCMRCGADMRGEMRGE